MKGRALLMIPGPIEFEPEVLAATGAPTTSHVAPEFIAVFARALRRMREVWRCPSGQPFVVAGSGTLAMEMAGANLIEPGDKALVLSTGYFGARLADLLRRYGAEVTVLEAPVGETIDPSEVERALRRQRFKLMTITHVDTSTGVLVDPQPLGALGQEYGVLTVVDGVCSMAAEELRQEEWGLDVALTASQKAIGVPPGLALLMASTRALETWRTRRSPVGNYYVDWGNWLPIMEAYEEGKASYFATPAVNLVAALEVSLGQILAEGMEARVVRHRALGKACRAAVQALELRQVPRCEECAASTLTAPYLPEGVAAAELLAHVRRAGVILAGGLHPQLKGSYFRIGHMGATTRGDMLATVGALEHGLRACGYAFEPGAGVAAAQRVLLEEWQA
ncbi:MAG: alanine--glyoxylate aminotransferase family protein [candidate division KSB1 bacterium]|nr:alanine--glyoxylate aminotransferase family protein [candidate division KSB1 bacterium]